jgi:hypothetical protein
MALFRYALLAILMLVATPSLAASLPAGFPSGSIWLSKTSATAGDALTVYTVVYNSSPGAISGDVAFTVDSATLDTKHFSADPGTTQIVSASWTATAGTHVFSAKIEHATADGLTASSTLASAAAGTVSVVVAAPPPPPKVVTDSIQTADAAQNVLASTTPILQNIASTTYATTESIRNAGLTQLQKLATAASPTNTASTSPKGSVLGISDYKAPQADGKSSAAAAGGAGDFFGGLWRGTLAFLIVIFSSQLWFYLLLLLVLFVVYKVIRTMLSERKYSRD